MRVRSDIRAGDESQALKECQKQRDYWKALAAQMEAIAKAPAPKPPAPAPAPPSPTGGSGCGWVNGVYYGDMSGACG